jgi:hypothetical protein
MNIQYLIYLAVIGGCISLPIIAFFSRHETYEKWAKIVCILLCIFGVSWAVSGFILIHWEHSISRHIYFILRSIRGNVEGICIGFLLSLAIAKPFKKLERDKLQPSA